MTVHVYKPGSIILFEMGEYSDYQVFAELVALQELDLPAAIEAFGAAKGLTRSNDRRTPGGSWRDETFSHSDIEKGFVAWLCVTQRCAQLECSRVHIGSYGRLEL